MIRDDLGEWRSLVSLIGHERLKEHLDLVANRIADDDLPAEIRGAIKASLLGLLSDQTSLTHPTVGELIRTVCESCDLGVSSLLRIAADSGRNGTRLRDTLATRVKRISIKPFMDMSTMIEERLTQCCVHVGTKSEADLDQCAPFCAVQAWPQLGSQKLSEIAGARVGSVPVTLRGPTEVTT